MEEITERLRQEIREELEQSTSESESAIDGDRAGQSGRGPRRYVDVTGLPDEVVDLLNTLDNDLDYIVQRYRNGKPCDDNERLVAQACIAIDGGRLRMVDPDAVRTEDGKAGPADQIDNENGVKGRHATNDPITEPETQIGDDDNEQSQDSEPGSGSETPQGDSPPSDTPDDGHYQGFEIC